MKRILNTLFVTQQKMYLQKEGDTVIAKLGDETKLQLPLIALSNIVCFGNIRVSPALMGKCAEMGVGISFLTENGKFLARVQGAISGNVFLRRAQYKIADDEEKRVEVVRNIVIGKISNSRTVIQRFLRDHEEKADKKKLNRAIMDLKRNMEFAQKAKDVDALRGIEGISAKIYFDVFNELIVSQRNAFTFTERSRRPPLDKVNALLSFVYTLLYSDIHSAIETVGLDPQVGFLHTERPGRMSLALDLMEEFRTFFADRLVLSLINLKVIKPNQFKILDNGAVLMNETARKNVILAYQKRKQDITNHPFLNKKMHLGLAFHTQALLMARFIRGDMDGYPPFIWR
jgi:CRISPR-associated protein Cas1